MVGINEVWIDGVASEMAIDRVLYTVATIYCLAILPVVFIYIYYECNRKSENCAISLYVREILILLV